MIKQLSTLLLLLPAASIYANADILGSGLGALNDNAGVIEFHSSTVTNATLASASIVFFGGTKSGHFCTTPFYSNYSLQGQYHFDLANGTFDYHLYPKPTYNAFQPTTPINVNQVHCIEFIINSGDRQFSPQVISFNVDCTKDKKCISNSAHEIVEVT